MTLKPRLIVTREPTAKRLRYERWNALTQEDRQGDRRDGHKTGPRWGMSAAQLIEAMGPLWIEHPEHQPRPRSLLPMPNLAGQQPVISCTDYGVFAPLFRWMWS